MAPLKELVAALEAYRLGTRADFARLIVFPEGTAHQVRVWKALLDIPAGETRTYGEVAARVIGKGNHGARAIGQAVGANPIPFLIPCHRVVAATGIGGYAEGLTIKRKLLDFERATYTRSATKHRD
jgi:methylated-DNA-[protein]-cysteine S-methyltransferase